jgi:hypothetical protein
MPYDPLSVWEWEGGAVLADRPSEVEPAAVPARGRAPHGPELELVLRETRQYEEQGDVEREEHAEGRAFRSHARTFAALAADGHRAEAPYRGQA